MVHDLIPSHSPYWSNKPNKTTQISLFILAHLRFYPTFTQLRSGMRSCRGTSGMTASSLIRDNWPQSALFSKAASLVAPSGTLGFWTTKPLLFLLFLLIYYNSSLSVFPPPNPFVSISLDRATCNICVFSNLANSGNCSFLANILHSKRRWDRPGGRHAAFYRWWRWALTSCQPETWFIWEHQHLSISSGPAG